VTALRVSLIVSVFWATSCASAYTVLRQAQPNPLSKNLPIYVEPLNFDGAYLENLPEADYLGRYAASSSLRAYKADKDAMDQNFRDALAKVIAPAALEAGELYRLRARTVQIFPGGDATAGHIGANTRGKFSVQLLSSGGMVLDEIEVDVTLLASQTAPLASDRIRQLGGKLAESVASYLHDRAPKR
jgi:hypothetical protein